MIYSYFYATKTDKKEAGKGKIKWILSSGSRTIKDLRAESS